MVFEAPEIEISSNAGDPTDIRNITGAVSLPTGASTFAEQQTQTTKLTSIDGKLNTLGQKTSANSMPVVISSDQIKNSIPSLSELGFPVRVIPYEPETYTLLAPAIVLGNNKSMVCLLNSGTKVLKIKSVKIINAQTSSVTGVVTDFRFKRITGFSAGTSLTPLSMDLNDTLASVTSAHNATVSGEASGDLFKYLWSSDEWGTGAVDVEAQDHSQQSLLPAYLCAPNTKPITLRTTQGLTIKCVTNTTAGAFDFEIIFTLEVA